jgi:hypothetical protein
MPSASRSIVGIAAAGKPSAVTLKQIARIARHLIFMNKRIEHPGAWMFAGRPDPYPLGF